MENFNLDAMSIESCNMDNFKRLMLKVYQGLMVVKDHLVVAKNRVMDLTYNKMYEMFVSHGDRFIKLGYMREGKMYNKLVLVNAEEPIESVEVKPLIGCTLHHRNNMKTDLDLMPELESLIVAGNEKHRGTIRVRDLLSEGDCASFEKLSVMYDDGECTERDITDLDEVLL